MSLGSSENVNVHNHVLAGVSVCSYVLCCFLISYSGCTVHMCVCVEVQCVCVCVCACLLFMFKGVPGLCSVQYIKVFMYNIVFVS